MKLTFFTIVLDGQPWITRQWPEFEKLTCDWQWHVIEGVAANTACTKWCAPVVPRLSRDGTTQYLDAVAAFDHRVILHRKELWQGKLAMVNEPLRTMHEPCLLIQIDSDEIWTSQQLENLAALFASNPAKNCAYFYCDYRVGPGLHITSNKGYGNKTNYEWFRAWKWQRGLQFQSHEPPILSNFKPVPFTHEETANAGLVFRHEAYSTEAQVAFKQSYYGSPNNPKGALYKDALTKWRRLQQNTKWPANLREFMPWCGEGVTVNKIEN